MMRPLLALVIASLIVASATGAQSRPGGRRLPWRDALQDAQVTNDNFAMHPPRGTALERRALLAADLSGKGFEARVTTLQLSGREFILVRGWTGEGTGLQQVSYQVFRVAAVDSLQLVWSAIAEERSTPPRWMGNRNGRERVSDRPYDMRACLYASDDRTLAYVVAGRPGGQRALQTPPAPPSGLYVWRESAVKFERVARAPSDLAGRCKRAAGAALAGR